MCPEIDHDRAGVFLEHIEACLKGICIDRHAL